jgi:hypothetical protein
MIAITPMTMPAITPPEIDPSGAGIIVAEDVGDKGVRLEDEGVAVVSANQPPPANVETMMFVRVG